MAFDPNLYAIQLELGVDASTSFDSLNELERAVTNVEVSLNKAMNATLAQASSQIVEVTKQLELNNAAINDFGTQQSLNIEEFNDYTKDNLKYTEETEKQLELYKEIKELYLEQNEAFQLSVEIQQSIDKILKSQSQTILEMMENASKAYAGFDTGRTAISNTGQEIERTTISHHRFDSALRKINDSFNNLSNAVQRYWVFFLKLTEATERFITVNNRAYGSMHEIIGQAHLTALSFGLLTTSVLDATEALINIGTAKESLEELTVALVETNRVTGLTYESLAELVRQYEATGEGVEGYTKTIESVMAAQRAFNLSTTQAQRVLDLHNASLFRTTNTFGNEAPKQIMKALLAMQAMTRDTGAAASVLENYAKLLNATGEELLELHGQIGSNPFAKQEVKNEAILNFYDKYAKALNNAGDIESAAYAATATRIQLEMEGRGLDMEMVLHLAALRRQAGMEGKTAAQIQEIYNQRIAEGRTITGEFATSMEGLVAQWNIFRNVVANALGPLVNWIADGMWPWIMAINTVIKGMYKVGEAILYVYRGMERFIPGLKMARQVVQLLIGGIVLLVGGLVILAAGLASVVVGLLSLISTIYIVGGALLGLGGAIGTFFAGAATSINTFFMRVATALGRIGTLLTPLIGPMLAFGASILMVGAGAWLLAQAFDAVAKHGWQGVAMFIAFTAVIALFGLAIVGLGYLSIAAAPGLLALGATILMIGAGVALMVGSVALLVMSFTSLLNAITPDIKERIIGLTDGLLYLSSSAATIAFGLGTIGFSLASVIIPLGLAALALSMVSSSLAVISNFKVPAIGAELNRLADEILSASDKLTEAGLALVPAASALIAGSMALIGASVSIAFASGVMLAAGVLLVVAGAIFVTGAGMFFAGATMFKTGAEFIATGANMIITGAKLIPEAAALLVLASSDLLVAGLAIMPGSMALAASAGYLAVAGLALLGATPALMAGATGFGIAASTVSKGIEKLEKSSIILYRFAIAARTLERLSFSGMRQGINDLGASASEIDNYVEDMEKASLALQNVRFDVTGFSNSISVAASSLTIAVDKLEIPIDKLSSRINEMIDQIDKLVAQEARVNELGNNLNSAMPDKPQDLQQPAEFKKADGQTEMVSNIIEVKNDSSEMVLLLKRLVALAERTKEDGQPPELGSFMSSSAPNSRLRNIGIDI